LHVEIGKRVAIKLLETEHSKADEIAERFRREGRAASRVESDHVVQVFDVGQDATHGLYMVMELLHGEDLDDYLIRLESTGQKLSAYEMFELLDPIVDTLEAAHSRGIVHRDLKPGNIFVLDSGGVRLLDFGLAKVLAASPLTSDGMIAGSPSYIAPEVWKGNPRVLDQRIDVYSLGAIVYRALSGKVPFGGRTLLEKFQLATTGERPSLSVERPDLPPLIDDWVAMALAIDPDLRFCRVRGMWNALRSVMGVPRT